MILGWATSLFELLIPLYFLSLFVWMVMHPFGLVQLHLTGKPYETSAKQAGNLQNELTQRRPPSGEAAPGPRAGPASPQAAPSAHGLRPPGCRGERVAAGPPAVMSRLHAGRAGPKASCDHHHLPPATGKVRKRNSSASQMDKG